MVYLVLLSFLNLTYFVTVITHRGNIFSHKTYTIIYRICVIESVKRLFHTLILRSDIFVAKI